jgi:hypothetical protein
MTLTLPLPTIFDKRPPMTGDRLSIIPTKPGFLKTNFALTHKIESLGFISNII